MLVVALVLVRLLNLVGLLSIAGCGLCVEPIELFLRVCLCIVVCYRYRYCYHGGLYNANDAELNRRLGSS